MGGLIGGSLTIQGYFTRMMYLSLYKMHKYALHGSAKVALDTLARMITRRTEPHVKLHWVSRPLFARPRFVQGMWPKVRNQRSVASCASDGLTGWAVR